MAAAGDSAYEGEFREIVYRHVEMIKEVIPAGEKQVSLQRQIGELLNELKDIFQGIYLIRDLSAKTSDTIVSYGERLSSIIVTELIDGAKWFDSRTSDTLGIDWKASFTNLLVRSVSNVCLLCFLSVLIKVRESNHFAPSISSVTMMDERRSP